MDRFCSNKVLFTKTNTGLDVVHRPEFAHTCELVFYHNCDHHKPEAPNNTNLFFNNTGEPKSEITIPELKSRYWHD